MSEINVDITPPSVGNITISRSDSPVLSVSGKVGIVTLNKNDVGLENVKNTSDYLPLSGGTVTGKVTINNSVEEGFYTLALNDYSHTEGWRTVAGDKAYFLYYSYETRVFSFDPSISSKFDYVTNGTKLYGFEDDVYGDYFEIIVQNRDTINGYITATSDLFGSNSNSGFFYIKTSNSFNHAEGQDTISFGLASHAEGYATTASGNYGSHAEGYATIASGDFGSHAEGISTTSSNFGSHAEGNATNSFGNGSHAEGYQTIASADASHSEGYLTRASGNYSHAEGSNTESKGIASHAAGFKSTAAQNYTYIWSDGNLGTVTRNLSTTRTGQYMISSSGGVFIPGKTGIGTDTLNPNILNVNGPVSIFADISGSGNLSIDNLLIGQNDSGLYFGNTKITENCWSLNESNFGTTWASKITSSNSWIDVKMSSDGKFQTAILLSNSNQIYTSNDYGQSWITQGPTLSWRAIGMSLDGRFQTAGASGDTGGKLHISSDYGKTWTQTNIGDSLTYWRSIAMSSDGKYQIAAHTPYTTTARVYISTDFGVTWNLRFSGNFIYDEVLISSDGKIMIITLFGSNIPTTTQISFDYGNTWSFLTNSLITRDISMSSNGKIISLMGETLPPTGVRRLYISKDFGKTFQLKNNAPSQSYVTCSSDGRVQILYGTNLSNQISVSLDYGETWTQKTIGNNSSVYITKFAMSSDARVINAIVNGTSTEHRLFLSYNDILTQGGISTQTLNLSSVQFTGETKTTTNPVTATDLYLKVNVNNQTKYIRLFDVL